MPFALQVMRVETAMKTAWTVKGISALASIIRKPLIMDYVTVSKCNQGVGLVRFARVMIKVNAKKETSDNVEVVYKSSKGGFQCRKNIKVPINLIKDRSEKSETVMQNQSNENGRKDQEGFVEVRSKKNVGINKKVKRPHFRANPQNNRHVISKESPDMKNDKASGSDKKVHEESIKKWRVWLKMEKDVLEEEHDFKIGTWNIRGLSSSDKQKEVMKFIKEENLQGCRIMIGWNEDVVSIFVIHMARQSAFEKLETISNVKFYGAFIYAANGGIEMRELWKDLEIYRRIVGTRSMSCSNPLLNVYQAKKKPFKFGANFTTEKEESIPLVNQLWEERE
ncbi:hypothetical protein Tco_0952669 [Tanacetum coccineum]|uniref:RNA-directed DNA polymerase, eukaryota, Reverse transcriptase zinc-binding domain protein n=1 Tax=Tanacetum coccineum TaxID=301880 RepID=A0ABQ5DYK4_9ASTR